MTDNLPPVALADVLARLSDHVSQLEDVGKRLENAVQDTLGTTVVGGDALAALQGADLLVQSLKGIGQLLSQISLEVAPDISIEIGDHLATLKLRDLASAIADTPQETHLRAVGGDVDLF